MHFLEKYYTNIIKYDLIYKFNYKNLKNIPKLKKIVLNFGCKTSDLKKLSTCLLALQLISNRKGKLTISKKSNILLKIRKGNPVGCKIILRKKFMYTFFAFLVLKILPNIKSETSINKRKTKKVLTYNISNIIIFKKLEKNYNIFNHISNLNITLITNTHNNIELFFLLNSLKFNLKNLKQK